MLRALALVAAIAGTHCRVEKPARAHYGAVSILSVSEQNLPRRRSPCATADWVAWGFEYEQVAAEDGVPEAEELPATVETDGWHEGPPIEWAASYRWNEQGEGPVELLTAVFTARKHQKVTVRARITAQR